MTEHRITSTARHPLRSIATVCLGCGLGGNLDAAARRASVKARGVKFGRKPKLTNHRRREATRRRDKGEPVCEIARTYNVSHSTISRLTA